MDQELAEMIQSRSKLDQSLGKQAMQIAVLKWANAHKDAIAQAGLTDSLLAALEQARN
jgi:hypothetical protein